MNQDAKNDFGNFEDLKNYYKKELPLNIEHLYQKFKNIMSENPDRESIHEFRNDIHKLSGSAGSFGFGEVSSALKELDLYFAGRAGEAGANNGIDTAYVASSLNRVKDILKEYANKESGMPKHCVTALPASHGRIFEKIPETWDKRLIICNPQKKKFISELYNRLSYFGYMIDYNDENVDKGIENAEKSNIYMIILDIDSLAGEPGIAARLVKIKEERRSFRIIYLSEKNDFENRLFALRNGGDAFFESPVNIIKLVDKIEYFTDNKRVKPDHILIVDDDMDTLSYYAHLFQQYGMITSVTTDPSSVFDLIIEAEPDLILVDMLMPGCNGLELAAVIRQHEEFVSIPIILYSAFDKPPVADPAMLLSGDEFISKSIDDDTLISITVNRINRSKSLRYFMERDSLTGLLNHTNLNDTFYRELLRSDRMGLPLSYAMIDLDNFKSINDRFGHLVGDTILKSLAYLLMERLRATDIIGRYGGEEFVAVLCNTSAENAKKVMDGIRENFSRIPHNAMGQEFYATFSCGIACFPDFSLAESISEAADKALYEAKKQGKNRTVIYGSN